MILKVLKLYQGGEAVMGGQVGNMETKHENRFYLQIGENVPCFFCLFYYFLGPILKLFII